MCSIFAGNEDEFRAMICVDLCNTNWEILDLKVVIFEFLLPPTNDG